VRFGSFVVAISLTFCAGYLKIIDTKGKAPSQGAKASEYRNCQADPNTVIYDGHYPSHSTLSTVVPPIEIYHPIFAKFLYLVENPELTNRDIKLVGQLLESLSVVSSANETQLNSKIHQLLRQILELEIVDEPNTDEPSADGVYMITVGNQWIRVPSLIMECKNELGSGGCHPSIQAGLTMRRSWIQPDVSFLLFYTLPFSSFPSKSQFAIAVAALL
jgi:hypothetical protein